jgi:CubicO group peptidase (beta-lactamase class C family)
MPASIDPARLDAIFAEWDRPDSPGGAVAVVDDGRVVFERGFGMADLSHGVPNAPDTPFHIASVSKQFTSAAILLLEQEGALALDDDVRRHLPEIPDFGVRIALHDLLHHTSGLRDQWGLLTLAGFRYSHDLITDEDVMTLVRRQRELNFPPGTRYRYSNTNTTLLAHVVRRISGETLREFTTRRIFAPLGMADTHFRDDHTEIIEREAFGYVAREGGGFRLSVTNFDTVGATSLYTTVRDLARWEANLLAPSVGGPDFADRMTTTAPLTTGEPNPYAMGLMLSRHRGLPTVEHGGADAGYRSQFLRFPEQRFAVALLFNTVVDTLAVSRRIADACLEGRFPETASVPVAAPGEAAGREGYYRDVATGAVSRIVADDDGSPLLAVAGDRAPMLADGTGYRLSHGRTLRFEPAIGPADRIVIVGTLGVPEPAERLPPFEAAPADIDGLAGAYASEELDATYRLTVQDGALVVARPKRVPEAVTAVGRDLFLGSDTVLRFVRDGSDRAVALLVTDVGGRVQDLRFARVA